MCASPSLQALALEEARDVPAEALKEGDWVYCSDGAARQLTPTKSRRGYKKGKKGGCCDDPLSAAPGNKDDKLSIPGTAAGKYSD